jgi:hypothetical protein
MRYGSSTVITPPVGSVVRGTLTAILANTFAPGDQIIAIATGNTTTGVVASAKALLSFTAPTPTLSLGSSTVVSMYDPAAVKQVTATIVDLYKNRGASLDWWCCNVSTWTGMTISASTPVDNCATPCNGFDISTASTTCMFKNVSVGKYIVTAVYANVSATKLFVVLANPNTQQPTGNTSDGGNATTPSPATVNIPQIPAVVLQSLRSVILSSNDISVAVKLSGARWSDALGYQWLVNGSDVTKTATYSSVKVQSVQLYFPAGVLASGASYNITYVVFAKAFPALMSVDQQIIRVVPVPKIRCNVVDPAGDQSHTTSRSSGIVIKAGFLDATSTPLADGVTPDAVANFAPQFRFGFYDTQHDQRGEATIVPKTVSESYQDSSFLKVVAPVVANIGTADSVSVTFFVALRLDRAEDVSVANCTRTIYRFADSVATVVTDAMESLRTAKSSNQVGTVISSALSLSTAVAMSVNQGMNRSSSSAAEDAQRASDALGNATNALQNVVTANVRILSTEQRSSILTSVDSLVSARVQSADATSSNTDAPAIDKATRTQLLDIIAQTVSVKKNSTDSTTSDTAFNAVRDGPTVLRTLDAITDVNDTSAPTIAKSVAASLASSANFGERPSMSSHSFSVVALANAPASIGGQSVATETASIRLPSGFGSRASIATSSVVSVTGTEVKKNPYGIRGLNSAKDHVASSVVDFTVFADGASSPVSDLSEAIEIRLQANTSSFSTSNDGEQKNLTCFYLDEATGMWSREGVVTVSADNVTGDVVCNTTHLSQFAIMVLNFASAPNPPSSGSGTTNGNDDSSSTTGIIVGVVVGVLVLAVIGAVVVLKTRSGSGGTGQKAEGLQDGGLLLDQPMMERHSFHESNGSGGLDQGGWSAKPVYQAPDTAAVNIEL